MGKPKPLTSIDANGMRLVHSAILIIYVKSAQATAASGIAKGSQTNPINPARNPKNMVAGTNTKTRTFVRGATNERRSKLYNRTGSTKICAATVGTKYSLKKPLIHFGPTASWGSNMGER